MAKKTMLRADKMMIGPRMLADFGGLVDWEMEGIGLCLSVGKRLILVKVNYWAGIFVISACLSLGFGYWHLAKTIS